MEKDFHYFMTYTMAKQTGHDRADVIAYASQFADDNSDDGFRLKDENCGFPYKIKTNGTYYYPFMTQSNSFIMDPYVQKFVYIPFHFIPGDNNVPINGKPNPFSTTPNSQNARKILGEAFKSNNPYRIGIALHTFADTWSHQNFTGLEEDWNGFNPLSIITRVGHAPAEGKPDVISKKWDDPRIGKQVDNRERALEAAEAIYGKLREATSIGPNWNEVKKNYREIIDATDSDDRIKKICDLVVNNGFGAIPTYSKNDWVDRALNINILDDDHGKKIELTMKPGFQDSHWYRFNQAAKSHLAYVLDLIQGL